MKNILIANILITITAAMMMVTFSKIPQVNGMFAVSYFYFSIIYSLSLSMLASYNFLTKNKDRGLAFLISLFISFIPISIFYIYTITHSL